MAHSRQTPQQKKQADYARNRRNTYGESPHGARTSIPENRRFGHKKNRAALMVEFSALRHRAQPISSDVAERVEEQLQNRRDKRWRKVPDDPLGFVVARKLARRGQREPLSWDRESAQFQARPDIIRWTGGDPREVR